MAKTRDLGRKRDKEQIFTCSSSNSSTSCEVTLSFQTWDLCHQVTLMGQAGTHSSQHQACGRGKIKFPVSPLDKESAIWLFASQEIPAERWIHIAESQRFGWDPLGKKKSSGWREPDDLIWVVGRVSEIEVIEQHQRVTINLNFPRSDVDACAASPRAFSLIKYRMFH